jgi:hypothetical protein
MCDYSLTQVKSRPAVVGDKIITTNFGTGTNGFSSLHDRDTAVCLLPGTELAFASTVKIMFGIDYDTGHKTAIFRQVNKQEPHVHHDAVEFPDGSRALLTNLRQGQGATVLQVPATPKARVAGHGAARQGAGV